MKLVSFIIFILFLFSAINVNLMLSYFALFFILIIILLKTPKSLRLSGGVRFWFFPFIFFFLISMDYTSFLPNSAKLISNMKMFFHLYVFSVIINFINDNVKLATVYSLLDVYKFKKIKFMLVFSIAIMKKMKTDIFDIFFFYRLSNSGISFFRNIYMLVYVVIRNSIMICYDMVEVLYLRRLYER